MLFLYIIIISYNVYLKTYKYINIQEEEWERMRKEGRRSSREKD